MHVVIVDDEKILASKISKKLQLNGFSVTEFYSYNDFLRNSSYIDSVDLFILDISLGDGSGFEIIKYIRNIKGLDTPIILISGFGDTQNVVFGLDLGADDYLTKPFLPEILVARVRAILRRPVEIKDVSKKIYKDITIDLFSRKIYLGLKEVILTNKEYLIVDLFISNVGSLISKDYLINYVWGSNSLLDLNDNTINVTLSKVRKKMGDNFSLQTKHNLGYILE